jgi:hypothetical protein
VTLACVFASHGLQSGAGSPGHLQALGDTGDSMSDGRGGANGPMRGSGFMRSPNSNFPAPSSKGFVTASPTRISAAVTAGERQSNPSASRLAAPRGSGDMPTRGCFGGDRYRDASRTCKFGGPEMAEVAVISGAEPSSRVPSTILFGLIHALTLKFKRLLRTNHSGFCRRNGFSWQNWGVRSHRPISEELQRDDAGSPRRRPRGSSHRVRCIADSRWNWSDPRSGVPAQRGWWSLRCGRGCRAAAPSRASATGCAGVHRRGHGCNIATIRHKFWERCRYSSPRCAGGRRASMERIHRRGQRMGWVQ